MLFLTHFLLIWVFKSVPLEACGCHLWRCRDRFAWFGFIVDAFEKKVLEIHKHIHIL